MSLTGYLPNANFNNCSLCNHSPEEGAISGQVVSVGYAYDRRYFSSSTVKFPLSLDPLSIFSFPSVLGKTQSK